MKMVRNPAVAGIFYPGKQQALSELVDSFLAQAAGDEVCPKVIIAPHAGYIYSGQIAAQAYSRLANCQQNIHRVVLLGPSHRVGFRGIAASTATAFRTPLGDIRLDQDCLRSLVDAGLCAYLDQAHAQEHSLEVQLPFLQRTLQAFSLIPLVVGQADKETVAAVLESVWGGEETLIVISSDLSHYHDYAEAQSLDRQTAEKILSLKDDLQGAEACGCKPLNGLLHLARQKQLHIRQLMLLNSGDTAGPKDRVVGYGAFVIDTVS